MLFLGSMFILYFEILVLAFLFGAGIGSFINAVAYRINIKKDYIKSRSSCPKCGHVLGFVDLIPIFSFLFLRGRCRYCKERISYQYIVVELISAIVFFAYFYFVGVAQIFNFSTVNFIHLLYSVVFIGIFLYIALYDYLYYEISDRLIIISSIITLIYFILLLALRVIPFGLILSNLFVGILAFLFFFGVILITRGKGMGGGDMKLAFLIGFIFGYPASIFALFIAFLIGSVVGLLLVSLKIKSMKSMIPFGPFLSCGVVLYIIFYQYLQHLVYTIFFI